MSAFTLDRKKAPDWMTGVKVGLQFLPAVVLLACALARPHWALWAGSIFQLAFVALLRLLDRGQGWRTLGTSALVLYLTAIAWLWVGLGIRNPSDQMFGLSLRSEDHTSELQSQSNLVCRLLLEKKTVS